MVPWNTKLISLSFKHYEYEIIYFNIIHYCSKSKALMENVQENIKWIINFITNKTIVDIWTGGREASSVYRQAAITS